MPFTYIIIQKNEIASPSVRNDRCKRAAARATPTMLLQITAS